MFFIMRVDEVIESSHVAGYKEVSYMILVNILLFAFICMVVADCILIYYKIIAEKERRKIMQENWIKDQ